MEVNRVGDLTFVMEEEDTHPIEGTTPEVKEPTARRKKFVEEKLEDERVNIDASTVDNKIHQGKEMDDDESKYSFGSRD